MAGLIAALARPQVSVAVPAEQASIVLAMDHSGSMQATDVAPSRLAPRARAGEAFLDHVPAKRARRRRRVRPPRRGRAGPDYRPRGAALGPPRRDGAERRHGDRRGAGGIAGDGPDASAGSSRPRRVVLLSDGESTSGRDPLAVAEEAGRLGIPVYTVALGTAGGTLPDGEPRAARPRIAARRSPSARAARVHGAGGRRAERRLRGARLAVAEKQEQREVTGAFAGGAILLLVGGGALAALVPPPALSRS